jgi:molybdate transport system substrate-binding protein
MAVTFKRVTTLFLAALICAVILPAQSRINVAAAANLTGVAQELGSRFEAETKIHPLFSFGSTAQLTQQIENGAPFDLFLAADAEHVDQLDHKKLLVPGSRAAYAIGVLALWAPSAATPVKSIEDLVSTKVRVIAVAKPELAPYGAATIETLRSAGILDKVQSKIVFADNINMAKQYGSTGNADVVFTAYSLVLKESGTVIPVGEKLHKPITQALGVIAASPNKAEAGKFADFILHGNGRAALKAFGYLSATP